GSMFQIFFTKELVVDYKTCKKSDTRKFEKMFRALLRSGIFIAPSQFETAFLSYSHTNRDLKNTVKAYHIALKAVKK
ncbi:MAG: aspartate aminotransferase family protein, partial [Nitrosopumilales archaeon]|nr:aspartate aminotransferase family protein [Nitrosopumilales archaeon]